MTKRQKKRAASVGANDRDEPGKAWPSLPRIVASRFANAGQEIMACRRAHVEAEARKIELMGMNIALILICDADLSGSRARASSASFRCQGGDFVHFLGAAQHLEWLSYSGYSRQSP